MKDEKKVPSIRFKGFTDAWEQRNLGNCFNERLERSAYGELISVTINDGVKKFIDLGRHDNSSEDKSKYKVVKFGDIVYNTMRMWQGASGFSFYSGIVSPAYTVLIPKQNIDSHFISFLFKRAESLHQFKLFSQGITSDTWNLKFERLSNIKINIPKISEQEQIKLIFISINKLITLHQRKLEILQNLKKSLLEKMFV